MRKAVAGCALLIVTLTPIFGYTFPLYAGAFPGWAGLFGVLYFLLSKKRRVGLTSADVLFVAVIGFFFFNFRHPYDWYTLWQLLDFVGLWLLARSAPYPNGFMAISGTILIAATIQSVWGLLQVVGVTGSLHTSFIATGSFWNPAPWGGVQAIAATLLAVYTLDKRLQNWVRVLMAICCLLTIYGTIISGSRAAWLALLLPTAFLLCERLDMPKMKRNLFCLATILVIAILIGLLYTVRPESSLARIHIWETCCRIFREAPLVGHGTGSFASQYMPAQAAFLETADAVVRQNAADNSLAYNECVKLLCEQGLIGFLLFAIWVVTCVRPIFKSRVPALARNLRFPLLGLFLFSQFSYPSEVPGLNCFLPLLLGLSAACDRVVLNIPAASAICGACRFIALCICIFTGTAFLVRIQTYKWIGDYATLTEEKPLLAYSQSKAYLEHDRNVLAEYCYISHYRGYYDISIQYHTKLRSYTQSAKHLLDLAEAYEYAGEGQIAIRCYMEAHRMVPGLITPLYRICKIYYESGNRKQAIQWAKETIDCPPKIENKRTALMKSKAQYIISQYEKNK